MDNTVQPTTPTQQPTTPAAQTAQAPLTTTAPQTSHPFWQHISKKTLGLIVILIVVTAGLLYLAIRQEQPTKQTAMMSATPTPSPAHATLSLVPETSSTSAYQTIDVMVQSNGNKIAGAQLALSYDPKVLTNVTIKPGSYLANPTVLFNTVDSANGRISYVFAISPTGSQASGSGILATISYTILPNAATTTQLTFLPKTALSQEGISGSVLKSATDLTIQIPHALNLQTTATPATGAAQ